MSSTFSPSLRIELIGDGDQSGIWGQTTNSNLGTLIEQAITGVQTITMIDANYTLSSYNGVADEARNQVLVLIGTNTAQRNLVAPLVEKTYTVKNSTTGGFAVQIIGASGTGVVIPNGTTTTVYCDGTNFYATQTGSAGNFTITGDLAVTGNETIGGTLAVTGNTTLTTGAISGVMTAPTAAAGTNTTQIATTAFVLQNAIQTGTISMWPTTSAPSGYLLCAGAAVSRSTYAALFALIGTTFGSGDGSTTFNLPNYTNRFPYGTTLGATGGSADAIVVSHTHSASSSSSVSDPGHFHYSGGNGAPNGGGAGSALTNSGNSPNNTLSASTGISVSTSTSITSAGSSGTNANLPPYLGINFIIKI